MRLIPATGRRVSRLTDALWLAIGGAFLLLFLLGALRSGFNVLSLIASGIVAFWIVGGSWLRTSWGQAWITRRRVDGSAEA